MALEIYQTLGATVAILAVVVVAAVTLLNMLMDDR